MYARLYCIVWVGSKQWRAWRCSNECALTREEIERRLTIAADCGSHRAVEELPALHCGVRDGSTECKHFVRRATFSSPLCQVQTTGGVSGVAAADTLILMVGSLTWWYRVGLDQRSCATSDPVSTRMGDRLWAGKPSRYVTSQLGRLSFLPSVGRYQLSG